MNTDNLDLRTRNKLAGYAEDELMGARVQGINIFVDTDGSIGIDEMLLRTRDGMDVSVGRRSRSVITIDVYDYELEKWRPFTAIDDYSEELEDITRLREGEIV